MSAARLAAEQAFAAPTPADAPAGEPLVIVRKARAPLPAVPPARAESPDDPAEGGDGKKPRIFRIGGTNEPRGDDAAPGPAPAVAPNAAPADDATSQGPGTTRRRRKTTPDKRPGPVRQVFQAPPRDQDAVDAIAVPALPRNGGVADHAAAMQGLQTAFDAIERAQAFRAVDTTFGGDWQRLSKMADKLHARILSALADGRPRPGLKGFDLRLDGLTGTRRQRGA